jgi:hypothetical protein
MVPLKAASVAGRRTTTRVEYGALVVGRSASLPSAGSSPSWVYAVAVPDAANSVSV